MVGETKTSQGDGKTPGGGKGQTPETTQTLTPEVDALITKANAALTNVGRLDAELRRSQSVANAALTRLKEMEDENYRKQEESAKDDPDELSRIRRRRQDAERQIKLEERETKVKNQLDKLLQVNAKTLAAQYNVAEELLLKYAGEDVDKMEELAKSFGERTSSGKSESKIRMTEPPDEGKTKGGSAGLTVEDIAKMSPEEKNRRVKEIAAIPF